MPKIPTNLHIGNTTFRRPWRIPEGLRVLDKFNKNYDFKNNPETEKYESELIKAISETKVLESDGKSSDWKGAHGRKFLNFCQKFGFVSFRPDTKRGSKKFELTKEGNDKFLDSFLDNEGKNLKMERKPFSLTPLGQLLKNTESLEYEINSEQKDIFSKSLYYQLQPSILNPFPKYYKGEIIRPLQLWIRIILELKQKSLESLLTQGEMAVIVSTYRTNDIEPIIKEIQEYRSKKKGKERKFAKAWYEKKGGEEKFETVWTYADPNFAYAESTGLFNRVGRKIIFNKDKLDIINIISKEKPLNYSDEKKYLTNFWSGQLLPFENFEFIKEQATKNYSFLKDKLKYEIPKVEEKINSSTEVKSISYKIEDKILELKEIEFFKEQRHKTEEIVKTLSNIETDQISYNGFDFEPEPEHLEWIVWRAFLAINSFKNEIKNSRGFKVDNNFLPTHHAAGGKEDLIFEFNDFVLLVEVTYKTGHVQFEDETGQVYRHTINVMKKFKEKEVYCLFLAPKINTNLVKGFMDYFMDNENEEFHGKIVPMEINKFTRIFDKLFHKKKELTPSVIKEILNECLHKKKELKPLFWIEQINRVIERRVSN
jgi:hypothetical protein